ncbi:MAG: endolytic transglycosylase MltG [Rubrivivax sp.]|nr:endolytic transglycosylase MltG [Rubrivivax sp.]
MSKRRLRRSFGTVLILLLVLAAGTAGWAWRWLEQPLPLRAPAVELSIEPGTAPRAVAEAWVTAGIDTHPAWLYQWFRWSGDARRIRAGSYEVEPGITPRGLLDKMVQGRETLETVRLPEGTTLRQWRAALANAPHLKPATAGLDDAALMAALGQPGAWAEGRFFPDTYAYSRGVSDLTVLKRALAAMQRQRARVWAQRPPDSPLKSPDELLILASIVEKETGRADERGLVAGVFVNRLRIGMPLQTDPTVIYGLGEAFDGNLRKRDLLTDGPYNTYQRGGLPPTPISMPSLAALQAAMNPAPTKALYFVARGDGSSVFSTTLDDHNRAVNKYQRGQP